MMTVNYRTILTFSVLTAGFLCRAQQAVTSIVTNSISASPLTYANVKGAGLRSSNGALSSSWDSTGTNFTVNFNQTTANITSVTQFMVSGHPRPIITWPLTSLVKVRRLANSYVNDTRDYFNYWALNATITPANNTTTGTFNLVAPEVGTAEAAFLTNNINSGYDNIFQNSINSLHANNIERVDFILPNSLKPTAQLDLDGAGALILDRGTGDPFKIAVILSLDGNNDPLTYGPLITVSASQFGGDLKAAPSSYTIMTHDPKYGAISRPSVQQSQNMRGVFISMSDMGVALNQRFYGYSLFGSDVTAAVPDWTTYPNNSDAGSQLDPANVLSLFKDANSPLPVPVRFDLDKLNNKPRLQYTFFNTDPANEVTIERSSDGIHYSAIGTSVIQMEGSYSYTDDEVLKGLIYYRLKFHQPNGSEGYSDVHIIRINEPGDIQVSPIPARDFINLSFPPSWRGNEVELILINTTGSAIKMKTVIVNGHISYSLSMINSGCYFLRVINRTNKQEIIKQVIKTSF
jgi:hypothetical protein